MPEALVCNSQQVRSAVDSACRGELAATVSKHLHVLAEAGLLVSWQEGRWRYYRWPGEDAEPQVRRALQWVRDFLAGDPIAVEDAARRAVAIEKAGAPCPSTTRPRVLFLCTGNSCRSQMAEGLLRKLAGDQFDVSSAGLSPKPIPPETFTVMQEIGVDLQGQRPKSVMEFLGREHFGYLITVCANAEEKCPIFPGASYRLYWPLEDTAEATGSNEERLEKFRDVRDQIERHILDWLAGKDTEKPVTATERERS